MSMPFPTTITGAILALVMCNLSPSPLPDPGRGFRGGVAADPKPDKLEFFEKKIRPVLVENCYKCHGNGKHKGNLELDTRTSLLKGGDLGPVVVPGQPEKSLLIKAISYTDDELKMPPKGKLADATIADFRIWVKDGANWPITAATKAGISGKESADLSPRKRPWSLEPLQNYSLPSVKNKDWPQSPIDSFILAKVEAAGLSLASPADQRTLIRRVTFDLTGLPPTVAEVNDFLKDKSPNAFEKVVDRLLASPQYGERWGRHWLDLVRFAETCGHEFDIEMPEAYVYRDYVIRAFNADVPYDQFLLEQMAGDLLSRPRRHPTDGFNESLIGTSFWFLGESIHSPVDIRADECDRIDNQIDVWGKTFLGMTVACARCHDHKFDPISSKDYYSLMGYLESSRYQRAYINSPEDGRAAYLRLTKVKDQLQTMAVEMAARSLKAKIEDFSKLLSPKTASNREDTRSRFLTLIQSNLTSTEFTANRLDFLKQAEKTSAMAYEREKKHVLFESIGKGKFQNWYVTGNAFGSIPSPGTQAILSSNLDHPVKQVMTGVSSGRVSNQLQGAIRSKTFVIQKDKILYRVAGRGCQINLIVDGYQRIRDPIYGGLTIAIDLGDQFQWRVQDVGMWKGQRAYIEILDDGPGWIACDKIIFSDDAAPPQAPQPLLLGMLNDPKLKSPQDLAKKFKQLLAEIVEQWRSGALDSAENREDRIELLNWMLQWEQTSEVAKTSEASHLISQPERERWSTLLGEIQKAESRWPAPRRAMAMADGTGWNEPVHVRGNHKIMGEMAPRQFLQTISGDHQPAPVNGSGRLELARRMIDSAEPLLARVMVNRIWQHHFGEGIVRSVDNFGNLGEPPTHPELLDFLAAEFIRQGWSIKGMHRLMVQSSTYQMAGANHSPLPSGQNLEEVDPENKLLHRMPVRRLEAECIRDAILAVSGRLDHTMYGPSVLPYLTPYMDGRGRPEKSGPLDGEGRRSIYINVRRNFLTPMFLAFDFPIPFTTIGRRSTSNVPAQALTLINNPFVMEQAKIWARQLLAARDEPPNQRITRMFEAALGRPPSHTELTEALTFLEQTSEVSKNSEVSWPDDLQAWVDLCHVLLNLKEFIYY